ncbi:cytochrome b/b6 domain-containing protein [Hephaestia mangrovi]|uniref:cytochrome b/b6 domain-containing protein n=1 Tax=Hephaestia mangrovi TaxID=2873268 RepID=UPI001CA65824|nr:cytochrome b/b6 domain-containing protein [Hephaestia mangrovi]MBY8829225.1 cytochrome b/b6 domain-containing protein [Hephaestia mangrovi]
MASHAEPLDDTVDAVPEERFTIFRHRLATRLWHWLNALTIFIMIGSGLGILNAHPHLYWGQYGANFDSPWLNLPHWPGWLTIPAHYNLAISRRWHLFFALVLGFGLLAFMIASLVNRHFQRDLRVRRREVAPRNLWADVKAHLAFRFHDPERPGAYNTLQKLSYVVTIFVLIPLMLLTGLAMSPAMDAAWPWLLVVTGGRQSARSLHFIGMALIVGFIIVHLALVILADPINEVKSMITGWWDVPEEPR